MRAGVIQQVDTPSALYEDPHNLFVAGFIGSPSMNFLPGRLEGDVVKTPFGDATLPEKLRSQLQREPGKGARDVIIGMRPEHFEDAAVEGDLPDRMRFRTKIDVVESMGSELYVYFDVEAAQELQSEDLQELAADAGMEDLPRHGDGAQRVVARLSADSKASPGGEAELSLDTSQIKLFEADDGHSMTAT
jgi:multiple sugar transport system ATP-binding protein